MKFSSFLKVQKSLYCMALLSYIMPVQATEKWSSVNIFNRVQTMQSSGCQMVFNTGRTYEWVLPDAGSISINEPHREKTGFLPRRKQRRRSASR